MLTEINPDRVIRNRLENIITGDEADGEAVQVSGSIEARMVDGEWRFYAWVKGHDSHDGRLSDRDRLQAV